MNILIIANRVGHEVQKPQCAEDDLAQLKQKLEQILRRKVKERGVEFIGEEADFDSETIAERLGLPWANIDMPKAERESRGIAEEQKRRIRVPSYLGSDARTGLTTEGYQRDVGSGWVELEPRLPSDTIREEYMFERVIKEAGDAQSITVICGILHSEELAKRFRRSGTNKVEVEPWPSV
jgi:hypothetical protein